MLDDKGPKTQSKYSRCSSNLNENKKKVAQCSKKTQCNPSGTPVPNAGLEGTSPIELSNVTAKLPEDSCIYDKAHKGPYSVFIHQLSIEGISGVDKVGYGRCKVSCILVDSANALANTQIANLGYTPCTSSSKQALCLTSPLNYPRNNQHFKGSKKGQGQQGNLGTKRQGQAFLHMHSAQGTSNSSTLESRCFLMYISYSVTTATGLGIWPCLARVPTARGTM